MASIRRYGILEDYIMPAITLGTGDAALICRMTRSSMLEVIRQDYIRTARAKGAAENGDPETRVKDALIPGRYQLSAFSSVPFLAARLLPRPYLHHRGIGRPGRLHQEVKDAPLVLGGVIMMTITFSIVNLCVDILYAFIDPRIKAQYRKIEEGIGTSKNREAASGATVKKRGQF